MKNLIFSLVAIFTTSVFAQVPAVPEKTCFPAISWMSKSSSDTVTVQNGNGTPILIVITMVKSGETDTSAINVKNCGTTNRLAAGSSVICSNSDANNPVSFSSDSASTATGTYQIKQQ